MLVKAIWNAFWEARDDARPVTDGPNILMGPVNHQKVRFSKANIVLDFVENIGNVIHSSRSVRNNIIFFWNMWFIWNIKFVKQDEYTSMWSCMKIKAWKSQ